VIVDRGDRAVGEGVGRDVARVLHLALHAVVKQGGARLLSSLRVGNREFILCQYNQIQCNTDENVDLIDIAQYEKTKSELLKTLIQK
jgi:hypothetical protein